MSYLRSILSGTAAIWNIVNGLRLNTLVNLISVGDAVTRKVAKHMKLDANTIRIYGWIVFPF